MKKSSLARIIILGVILGSITGIVLSVTDYVSYWNDHIYYMWHKQYHKLDDGTGSKLEYHFHSNMEDLDPITWSEARTAFGEAVGEWNSGSSNLIWIVNQQDTSQDNQIYSDSMGPLADATWNAYETKDGKSYRRPTEITIRFNKNYEWEMYGGLSEGEPFSLRAVALHELGHWLDLDDIYDDDYEDAVMYAEGGLKYPYQHYLNQIDKTTIKKIYKDPRWNHFDMGVFYQNPGYDQIWAKVWEPAWFEDSSSGPSNPPDMTVNQKRTFYVDTAAIRGAEQYGYSAHTKDITMRVIWDDNKLSLYDWDTYEDSPWVTEDGWWFQQNPYSGSDTAWLCVNYNAGQFSSTAQKGAEIWVELQAEQTATDTPVIVRVTSADYHANPWMTRAENYFRFDIDSS